MLHPKAKLLEVFPLLGLLAVVHHDVRLLWGRRALETDLPGAPVLELFLRAFLYPPYELLHHLKRPPMMQEKIKKGRELPVILESRA
jgi:hypothetical protein